MFTAPEICNDLRIRYVPPVSLGCWMFLVLYLFGFRLGDPMPTPSWGGDGLGGGRDGFRMGHRCGPGEVEQCVLNNRDVKKYVQCAASVMMGKCTRMYMIELNGPGIRYSRGARWCEDVP